MVEASFRTYTAQGAFLKSLAWIVPLVLLFFILPFHLVLALQRELQADRHADVLALLAGDRLGVAPRGAVFIRVWALAALLTAAALGVVPGASYLFDHLKPSPFQSLYTVLYFTRWGLYFGLGLACVLWYQRMLDEVRRECLLVLRLAGKV